MAETLAESMKSSLEVSDNYSYPLFFENETNTFVLVVESKANIVTGVKLGINSRLNPKDFFTVIARDNDGTSLINIVDEDIDSALYSIISNDREGNVLHITIVPSDNGAVVVVNTTRTALMESPPFIGKITSERIEIQHKTIIGLDVLVSGIPSTSADFDLNGKRGKVCGFPQQIKTDTSVHKHGVPVEFKVPVAFLKGEIVETPEKRLINNAHLVDISM